MRNNLLAYAHTWYAPGDWSLPDWWTSMPPGRTGGLTRAEQKAFYGSLFARQVLGHHGGIAKLPTGENYE